MSLTEQIFEWGVLSIELSGENVLGGTATPQKI